MTWFFWWVKTWFCEHSWETEEIDIVEDMGKERKPILVGIKVSATCEYCGWHRSYSKI